MYKASKYMMRGELCMTGAVHLKKVSLGNGETLGYRERDGGTENLSIYSWEYDFIQTLGYPYRKNGPKV